MDQSNWDKKRTVKRQKTETIQVSYKALESATVKVGEYSAVEILRSGENKNSGYKPQYVLGRTFSPRITTRCGTIFQLFFL